jgi:hypothetical protein
MVIVTKADGRFADIKPALAEARAKPGTVSIGHAGNGTTNHIGILRLQVNEKVQFNVIPYKESGPGLNEADGRSDRSLYRPAHDVAAAGQSRQTQGLAGAGRRSHRAASRRAEPR